MASPLGPWVAKEPARRRLSVDGIVAAGLEILAADGADAVTMRAVAGRLGTGAASLYAHVRDKSELHALLLDAVIGEVEVPAADPKRWREQIKQFSWSQYRAMVRHPGIAGVSLAHIPTGPNAMRCSEGMLAILLAGGLSRLVAALAVDVLTLYVSSIAFEETLWWDRARHEDPSITESSVVAATRDYFRALPPDDFPLLSSMADELTGGTGDQRFDFGLDVLIAGLDQLRDWRLPGASPAS
jgi:AcrR family transcriptional regulator